MQDERIVKEARRWIGTPYRHQGSCRGAGCDCLGLVRGVWRAVLGDEPEAVPAYTPDWAETAAEPGADALLLAARRYFIECPPSEAPPGALLLFRPRRRGAAKHCAILSKPGRIIHAYWGRQVAETALTPWWKSRLVAAFRFPRERS
ncbi:MAG: NlpC/P60 family protein [Maricaulis sp.]|uniref:NlpC/P60 family protein n=1 Tax=Maricaulis sp. TaxID=1486257 RepID=UPI001B113BFE|nr:NlpC/P60 family protein [Maricaulis sp.]MBO6728348.1 C40 family peptidase [Maricaulis sp.]MBO6848290.1 C40 family peptidase [Maricaulis sp.]MBO6878169.1 C40 family peptidase [Maricaulis sp.]MDM7983428.1 NlpC/P60 family protein [Maricaulis sp.]